jgi:Protein of unknown function (DUF4013)
MQSWASPPPSSDSATASRVSVGAALRFAFDAPERNHNLVTGSLLMLIPIAGPIALSGFLCEVHQRLVRGRDPSVPRLELSDISHYLGRGMPLVLVELALGLPIALVGYGAIAVGLLAVTSVGALPQWLSTLGIVLLAISGLGAALVFGVLFNAARTRAELSEEFVEALSFTPLLRYAVTTAPTVLAKSAIFLGVSLLMTLAGLLACCVGVYPVAVLLQIAAVHLRWQVYDAFVKGGGTPVKIRAPADLPSEGPDLRNMYGGY